jgi:hypothetical protein
MQRWGSGKWECKFFNLQNCYMLAPGAYIFITGKVNWLILNGITFCSIVLQLLRFHNLWKEGF